MRRVLEFAVAAVLLWFAWQGGVELFIAWYSGVEAGLTTGQRVWAGARLVLGIGSAAAILWPALIGARSA